MIHHIVLFRFRTDVTESQIAAAGQALLDMMRKIPDIHDIRWRPNLAMGTREYSHVLTVVCADMDAVARYSDHPHHKAVVADYLAPIREARMAIDVEVGALPGEK